VVAGFETAEEMIESLDADVATVRYHGYAVCDVCDARNRRDRGSGTRLQREVIAALPVSALREAILSSEHDLMAQTIETAARTSTALVYRSASETPVMAHEAHSPVR
jgi:DNA-binding IclR family transcriptional regulator